MKLIEIVTDIFGATEEVRMDQITHQVRMEDWKALIAQCQSRPEGQTAKQWLLDNGISDKKYYYWLRKIRRQSYQEMHADLPATTEENLSPAVSFAEIAAEEILSEPPVTAITIHTKKATIEITTAVSSSLMVELIKAVRHAL